MDIAQIYQSQKSEEQFNKILPFITLLKREILRFVEVSVQAILAPVVSASLYLLVFGVSLGQRISVLEGFNYAQFVIPGLILMGVINNAFINSSSSLFMNRYLGSIVEILVTPITPNQFIWAYTLASMLRAIIVGVSICCISLFFAKLPWIYPLQAIGIIILASFLFAQFGIIAALYSNTFETMSMFTNFLIIPLIYLGGLFYPISLLPPFWAKLSALNPLFYIIDGFRHAALGVGDTTFINSFTILLILSATLLAITTFLVYKGFRLRD